MNPAEYHLDKPRLTSVLVGNGLKRIAGSAGGVLIGFYLAFLAGQGRVIDAALVGALGVVFNFAELSGAVPMGMLVDRFTPRTLMLFGTLLGAAATQLFGLSSVVAIFFLARALEGLAAGAATPAILAQLTDVTEYHQPARGRVFGFFELTLLVGLALGGLVGGLLWDAFHTAAFSLVAIIYLLAAALFYWGAAPAALPVAERLRRGVPQGSLREAMNNKQLRRLAPAWLAANAILGMWLTHAAFQLAGPEVGGQLLAGRFTATEVGQLFLVYAIVFGLGIVGWGFALARISRLRVMRVSLAAIPFTALWLYLLNTAPSLPAWVRWGLMLLTGITILIESGFTPAALVYLADVAGRSQGPGTVMGIYSMLFGLGNILGALTGGIVGQVAALNGLFVATVVLALLGLAALSLLPEATVPAARQEVGNV